MATIRYKHHDGRTGTGPTNYDAMVDALGLEEARANITAGRAIRPYKGAKEDLEGDGCPCCVFEFYEFDPQDLDAPRQVIGTFRDIA